MATCELCEEEFERPATRGPAPKYCSDAHRQAAHRRRSQLERVAASSDFAALLRNVVPQMAPPNLDLSKIVPSIDLSNLMPKFDFAKLIPQVDLSAFMVGSDLASVANGLTAANHFHTPNLESAGPRAIREDSQRMVNMVTARSIVGKIPTIDLGPLLAQFDTAPFREQIARLDLSTLIPSSQIADLIPDLDLTAHFPTLDLSDLVPDIDLSTLIDSEVFASLAEQIKAIDWAESLGHDHVLDEALTESTEGELDPEQVNGIAITLILAGIANMLALASLDEALNEFIVDASKMLWIVYLMALQLQQSPQGTLATTALSYLVGRTVRDEPDDLVESESTKPADLGALVLRHRSRIVEIAARRGATNVRLFGSAARGEATSSSDVDFLVDIEPGVSLVGLAGLERELTELLRCDVDVVPAANLKPALLSQVESEAIAL
jgi:predicted nucleotidyltransferase